MRRKLADRKLDCQTPQFEGGNMNLMLFSFDKGDVHANFTQWCLQIYGKNFVIILRLGRLFLRPRGPFVLRRFCSFLGNFEVLDFLAF